MSAAIPSAAKIGINNMAVAVFEVISVKNVTNRQIAKINNGTGKAEKALAIHMPQANHLHQPYYYFGCKPQ
jgi:hypothetical protein